MRRRTFIAGLGSAAAWPLTGRAQQRVPVIGFLGVDSLDASADRLRGFNQGLRETGFVEGRNVTFEYRWADDRPERLPALAADLVRQQVTLIVTGGSTDAALAGKRATMAIPVVFATASDPVKVGLVTSLSRPGGNITGIVTQGVELMPKQLELLHEIIPSAATLAALVNPANPALAETTSTELLAAAGLLGV